MVNPYSYTSKRAYTVSRDGLVDSVPLLKPQGIEHIAPRKPSSRFTSLGTTARRIVSGGSKRTTQHLNMPPPVSSSDHWYGPTVEITASPRPPLHDMEIGSFRRPSVPPKSPRHLAKRAQQSRSSLRLRDQAASRSTLKSSSSTGRQGPAQPPPSPSPSGASHPSLPEVVRRFAPACVTAIEEEKRVNPPNSPSTHSPSSRLLSSLVDRPLPPLPTPLIPRKAVPIAAPASRVTQAGQAIPPEGVPPAKQEIKKTVSFDFAPVKGFTPRPVMSSSSDSFPSVYSTHQNYLEGTPVPSFIKIGNQKLADFENAKSLYDELRDVLGLRGLCLTRADLAWDLPSPCPSPRISEASLPLTPMTDVLSEPPSPEILIDVTIDLDPPTPTRAPYTPASQKTLRRFSSMAFEDQFQEVFDAINKPIAPTPREATQDQTDTAPAIVQAQLETVSTSSSRLLSQAQEPRTPRRSTLLHVSSLRAQVGTISPQPKVPPHNPGDIPRITTRWPTKQGETRFVSSGLNEPIRKKRVPSGPRALSGMSSDEWLKKKEIKVGIADATRATRDAGPEDAGPSRFTTTPTTPVSRDPQTPGPLSVLGLGRILSQEPLVNSAELSIQGRALMREARRSKHREV